MRTIFILSSGLLIFTGFFLYARLFVQHYPSAVDTAVYSFAAFWLVATAFNCWVGVHHAGYSVREELPIMLVLFVIPTAVALATKWKVV